MASTRKSVTAQGTTRWQAIWREPGPGGSTRQRTRNFGSLAQARAFAGKVEQEVERKGVANPNKYSLRQFLDYWLAARIDRGEHRAGTIALYRRLITRLISPHIGDVLLEKLAPPHIDGLYAALQKPGAGARGITRSATTVLQVHKVLSVALEQARKWKLIGENPVKDATPPSPRKSSVHAFTQEEVDRLLAAAAGNRETYTMLVTLLVTGARRGELIGLAWDCVDLDRGLIEIRRTVVTADSTPILQDATKTEASTRTIQIPPLLIELLRAQRVKVMEGALKWGPSYRRQPLFCFPQANGEPHDPIGMTFRLRQVMRRAGITGQSPCHAWRHTAATLLVSGGSNVKVVQTLLGHASPAITMSLYVHPTQEREREAGEYLAGLVKRPPSTT